MFIFRPIFIVNTVSDSDCDNDGTKNGINKSDLSLVSQRADMEINNNNSLYLHEKCEDKGDKSDNRMQCENKISQTVVAKGFSRQRIVENSLREIIDVTRMNAEVESVIDKEAFKNDSDVSQAHNEIVTQFIDKKLKIPVEIARESDKQVNESCEARDKSSITSDSGGLVQKSDEEVIQLKMTTSKAPLINERTSEVTTLKGESEVCSIMSIRLLQRS